MGRTKVNKYAVSSDHEQQGRLRDMLCLLELEHMASSLEHVKRLEEQQQGTYYDFLESLVEKEIHLREEARIERWNKAAKFPAQKSLETFDFSYQPDIDEQQINELASTRFIKEGKNVIFLGPPGVGKTHLSIALGRESILKGYETRFLTIDKLVEQVRHQDEEGLRRLLRTLTNPPLLIIDDIDYEEPGRNVSAFLFKLIFRRDETGVSTIFTSNKPFQEWEQLFSGDKAKATAAIDRICGNGSYIISIKGDSYRVRKPLHTLASV